MAVTAASTLADYLRPLGPHLPPQLISAPTFENLQRLAHIMPVELALSSFGFGCPLTEEEAVADLHLSATAAANAYALAHAIGSGNMLLRNHPTWQGIYDFIGSWTYEGSDVNCCVADLWLRFDTRSGVRLGSAAPGPSRPSRPSRPSLPVLGLAPNSGCENPGLRRERCLAGVPAPSISFGIRKRDAESRTPCIAAVCKALTLLRGGPVPASLAQSITDAILALPATASLVMAGAPTRRGADCNLVIRGLDRVSVPAYLRKIGLSPHEAWVELLADTSGFCDHVYLNLYIREGIYYGVTWSCYYDKMAQPVADPSYVSGRRWICLLDHLVAAGLCVPSKREGLLAYMGVMDAGVPVALRPESPSPESPSPKSPSSALLGEYTYERCTTALHHIKIDYRPGKSACARAYLCANYEQAP